MTDNFALMIAAFVVVSSGVLLAAMLVSSRRKPLSGRLADVSPLANRAGLLHSASAALPNLGAVLMPEKESTRERIHSQMIQAGFYWSLAASWFFGIKFLLMVSPVVVGLVLYGSGTLSWVNAVLFGTVTGLLGTVVPSIWIARRKAIRQRKIRRALPDALDVIVICLEGGLSLSAAFARVTEELSRAYALLASEMVIVRRQIELGQSTADAFRDFADRFDSEELRSLAVLIAQADRFGASLVRTLRIQAEGLRLKRYQWAEAQAQKAPLKLIFPTVLCIFPALYIVLMGPAGVELLQLLDSLGH